jgi:hypothetical protein
LPPGQQQLNPGQSIVVVCQPGEELDSIGNCVPEVPSGADTQESFVAPIVKETTKTGEVIGGRLGEIEKAVVGDNPTLGSEMGLLSLAGIIGAIGAIVIAVYKVKHRNRKSKSYPSSVNVDVITHGGIEE